MGKCRVLHVRGLYLLVHAEKKKKTPSDHVAHRTFTKRTLSRDDMTNDVCTNFCDQWDFTYAGTEWGRVGGAFLLQDFFLLGMRLWRNVVSHRHESF